MRRLPLVVLVAALTLSACHSLPEDVLSEGEMVDLLVDVYKGEAIVEANGRAYRDDSSKAVIKQSIFAKHGVTQAQYDSSMVYYSHHSSEYIDIYDEVIARLEDEEYRLKHAGASAVRSASQRKVVRTYPSSGDSADIWDKEQVYTFQHQYGTSVLRFDYITKADDRKGDRYRFSFRLYNATSPVTAWLGVDYPDGSASYVYRNKAAEGENSIELQADSTKRIRRVYGYITASPATREAIFVDSIMLLRTRLDSIAYSSYRIQKWTGPSRLAASTEEDAVEQDTVISAKTKTPRATKPRL